MCFPKQQQAAPTTPAYVPPPQTVSAGATAPAEVKGAVAGVKGGVSGGSSTSGQQDNIQARRRRRASANLGL